MSLHHAKIFLKYLTNGPVVTDPVSVDPGILSPTVANLAAASAEEEKEGVEQYTKSAEVAEEEGFSDIMGCFPFDCQDREPS